MSNNFRLRDLRKGRETVSSQRAWDSVPEIPSNLPLNIAGSRRAVPSLTGLGLLDNERLVPSGLVVRPETHQHRKLRRHGQAHNDDFWIFKNLQRYWLAGRIRDRAEETYACSEKGPRFSNSLRPHTSAGSVHNRSETSTLLLSGPPNPV